MSLGESNWEINEGDRISDLHAAEASEWCARSITLATAAAKPAIINAIAGARYDAPFHKNLIIKLEDAFSADIEAMIHDWLGDFDFGTIIDRDEIE